MCQITKDDPVEAMREWQRQHKIPLTLARFVTLLTVYTTCVTDTQRTIFLIISLYFIFRFRLGSFSLERFHFVSGAVVDGHGRSDSEVSRKLGCAKANFKNLSKLWAHTGVTTKSKLKYFHALIPNPMCWGCMILVLRPPSFFLRVLLILPSCTGSSKPTSVLRAG